MEAVPSSIPGKQTTRRSKAASENTLAKVVFISPLSLSAASDVQNWKGPWAGYQGEEEDHMTSEEKGEMTEWQRVWLERNKDKKVREVGFPSRLDPM